MQYPLFARFAPIIQSLSSSELQGSGTLYDKLLLERAEKLSVHYVPFEHLNPGARLVIVGITPGKTQLVNAIAELRRQLDAGSSQDVALRAAKATGAFSGAMRPNLISLLNRIGMQRMLGIGSCADLFGSASHLLHSTSALRNPVFVDGANYSGNPKMTRHPLLKKQLLATFGEEAKLLPSAVFVPLGDAVDEALQFLAAAGVIKREQILSGLPHPSGANAERIMYFVGGKAREKLSSKTNADKIERTRDMLCARVTTMSLAV
ncbi:hypothetical protein [Nevskia ramosa]|uniref:hypothetical protein n=1 Tax=Nevskia ramosa TaxID=64002 RepID=UPI003D12A690